MVQQCLAVDGDGGSGSAWRADVVAGGVATVDRPAMPDLVSELARGAQRPSPELPRAAPRTRTRGCGPSTRPTPPTSSAAATWSTRSSPGSASDDLRRPARAGRRRLGDRQVERGARRGAAAASAAARWPALSEWFVTTMLPGELAVQGAGREPPAGRRHRDRPAWPTPGRGRRCHRPGAPRPRPRGRPAAAGRRPVRGAVHLGDRSGPAGLPRRRGARPVRTRQPAAGGRHVAGRLLRPTARRPGLRCPGQRRDGDHRRDVAGRAGGGHRRAGRAGGPAGRTGTGRRARERRRRRAGRAARRCSSRCTSWREQPGQEPHAGRLPGARRGRRRHRLAGRAAVPLARRRRAGRGAADVRAARRRRRRGRAHPASGRPRPSCPASPADRSVDAADRPVGAAPDCSPSIAIPRPGCRPSRSPTRPCCASGPACGLDRRGPRRDHGARPPA